MSARGGLSRVLKAEKKCYGFLEVMYMEEEDCCSGRKIEEGKEEKMKL